MWYPKKRNPSRGIGFALLAATVLALVLSTTATPVFGRQGSDAPPSRKTVGYFISWGVYGRDFHVSDIPADRLTHINYAFANISDEGEVVLGDPYADIDKYYPGDSWDPGALRGSFHQLQILKTEHPHLQTLISVGGWTWSGKFSDVALTEQSRREFAESCVDFIKQYGFDGVDIDWEYPVGGGMQPGRPEDKVNYTLLLEEIRNQLDAQGYADGRHYLLTISSPAGEANFENIELDEVHQYLDWINMMTYDFNGGWSSTTNFNAPLYSNPDDPSGAYFREKYNVDYAVDAYLSNGIPEHKLVLGVPFYGRGWSGVPGTDNGLFQPAGGVPPGTWEDGMFDYWDLEENYIGEGYTRHWSDDSQVPWLYNPETGIMITYDDPESLGVKSKYVSDRNLGGVMIWELSADDTDDSLLESLVAQSTNPVPSITSLYPNSKTAGRGAFTLTVNGTGFVPGSVIRWDGTDRDTTLVSAKELTATIGGADIATPGTHVVTVHNPTPGGGTSNSVGFEVESAPAETPAWYLAEGSTAWGYDCYISIENANPDNLTAEITYMTTSGEVNGGTVYLPAWSQTTVNPGETLGERDFSTRVVCVEGKTIAVDRTMSWSGRGSGAGVAGDRHCSIGATAPDTTWYLPEGSSAWGFECWHLIQNPNDADAEVTLTYMVEGEEPQVRTRTVPAGSRATYNMEQEIGQKDASLKVESDLPVIPERAMYRYGRQEGHGSLGTTEPALDYYLAEGTTAWGFTTYLLIQNPQGTDTSVDVTYMTGSGPVSHPENPIVMPPDSRRTIRVNDFLHETDFSTRVTGDRAVIAERAMYWGEGTETGEACHDSIGMDAPHACFYLPDGQAGNGVETWTLVQNPNPADVEVTINYLPAGGESPTAFTDTVPANSRKTYRMADAGMQGRASVFVECVSPGKKIMCERAMYWNSRGAGTGTVGAYTDID